MSSSSTTTAAPFLWPATTYDHSRDSLDPNAAPQRPTAGGLGALAKQPSLVYPHHHDLLPESPPLSALDQPQQQGVGGPAGNLQLRVPPTPAKRAFAGMTVAGGASPVSSSNNNGQQPITPTSPSPARSLRSSISSLWSSSASSSPRPSSLVPPQQQQQPPPQQYNSAAGLASPSPMSSVPSTPSLPAKELPVLGLGLAFVGGAAGEQMSSSSTSTPPSPYHHPYSSFHYPHRPQASYHHYSYLGPSSSTTASAMVSPSSPRLGGASSLAMTSPTSSSGLPSPNFANTSARPLSALSAGAPGAPSAATMTPVIPPRNPARPPSSISISVNGTPGGPSSTFSSHSRRPSAASIGGAPPPPPRSPLFQHQRQASISALTSTTGASFPPQAPSSTSSASASPRRPGGSRRNSRQVSVRLSSGFSSAIPSRSVSRVRTTTKTSTARGHQRRESSVVADAARVPSFSPSPRPGPGSFYDDDGEDDVYVDTDVLARGERIGAGLSLQGQLVRTVTSASNVADDLSRSTFEVVRKLGTGSYAVVYLVREVLPARPLASSRAGGGAALGRRRTVRGRRQTRVVGDIFDVDYDAGFPGDDEEDDDEDSDEMRYGREFAVKCLSKANLNPEELEVQMTEATIHQSLVRHPNIVGLYATLETDAFLLLVLEYVPGEDLYYFLEQSRDSDSDHHHASDSTSGRGRSSRSSDGGRASGADAVVHGDGKTTGNGVVDPDAEAMASGLTGTTPTTPGLLASVQPHQLLSYGRLKLIASMFKQMCDAVEACHQQGVSHRDIKPENFIVSSSSGPRTSSSSSTSSSSVIVKLSDFGLATTERFSADVDCGSAPYMSYECRNNVGPTYATQSADVWSLGIVLINMLYHHNLWHDTHVGDPSFEAFRAQPVTFLMQRSPGMTQSVAEFLADRVFRVLPSPPASQGAWAQYEEDVRRTRVSAGEFGLWAKNLPYLFSAEARPLSNIASRAVSVSGASSRRSALIAPSPYLRHSPHCEHGKLASGEPEADEHDEANDADETFRNENHVSSIIHGDLDVPSPRFQQATVPSEPMPLARPSVDVSLPAEHDEDSQEPVCIACLDEQLGELGFGNGLGDDGRARTMSGTKRRRRGARKNKNASISSSTPGSPEPPLHSSLSPLVASLPGIPDELDELAQDTQILARELSRANVPRTASRSRSRARVVDAEPFVPSGQENERPSVPLVASVVSPVDMASAPAKKPSKWAMFGRSQNVLPAQEQPQAVVPSSLTQRATGIVNSLESTYTPQHRASSSTGSSNAPMSDVASPASTVSSSNVAFQPPPIPQSLSSASSSEDGTAWRGRRSEVASTTSPEAPSSSRERWDRSPAPSVYSGRSNASMATNWRQHPPPSAPSSLSSFHPQGSSVSLASSASSVYSSAPSSTFTRFRNGSEFSVSTMATSVSSASSAFNSGGSIGVLPKQKEKKPSVLGSTPSPSTASLPASVNGKPLRTLPVNVKRMDGVPWALDELPRQMRPTVNGRMPQGDIFGGPPPRRRANKAMQPTKPQLEPISERERGKPSLTRETSISSTTHEHGVEDVPSKSSITPDSSKKVQKAQVTSLAKLLTSFKSKGRDT